MTTPSRTSPSWAGGDISNVRRAAEQVLATTKRLVESIEIDLGIELAPDVVSRSIAESNDVTEIDSRIMAAVPEAIPEPAQEVVPEAVPLPGFAGNRPETTVSVLNGENRRFLKAILDDLEPDQREHFMQLAFDRHRAGEAAVILAESGKSATQVGRVLDCLHVEPEAIRDALLYRVADGERPTLFTVAEARAALRSIDDSLDLDDLVPLVERPTADDLALGSAGEQVADLQLVQRALRRHDEPAKVAALAYGLDLQPATVIGICRATGTEPSRAMAVAIAVRDGDARTAYHDVTAAWPDVEGGWEHHTHPSLRPKPSPRRRPRPRPGPRGPRPMDGSQSTVDGTRPFARLSGVTDATLSGRVISSIRVHASCRGASAFDAAGTGSGCTLG